VRTPVGISPAPAPGQAPGGRETSAQQGAVPSAQPRSPSGELKVQAKESPAYAARENALQRGPSPEMLELMRMAVQRGVPVSEVERLSKEELRRRLAALKDPGTLILAVAEDERCRGGLRAVGYLMDRPQSKREDDVAALRSAWVGEVLSWAVNEMHGERDLVMAAVRPGARRRASPSGVRTFVLAAVARDWSVLGAAARELQTGGALQEIILAMVAQSGDALDWAVRELRQEREVVLAAVAHRGGLLEWTSPEFQGEICLAAVAPNSEALQRASRELWTVGGRCDVGSS